MENNKDIPFAAIKKIKEEFERSKNNFGKKERVMAKPVLEALESFIGQDTEFAEAIIQNSQTFGDCLREVAKDAGNAISDLEAYKKAVRFYFPGAEIEFQMKIFVNPYDLQATDDKVEKKRDNFKTLSLLDILG